MYNTTGLIGTASQFAQRLADNQYMADSPSTMPGDVQRQLAELETAISKLEQIVDRAVGVLNPITAPVPADKLNESKPTATTPLGSQILGAGLRVHAATTQLSLILDAVSL